MKKFFSMMVVLATAFTFAACEDNEEPSNKPAPTPEKEQLATPVLSVSNVTTTGFTVSWAAIENAANYMVLIDGANSQTITETTVTFSGLTSGEHTVGVKAMAAAGSNYSDSALATIKQAVEGSNDWFAQEVYTRNVPEKGIYDCNCIFIKWSGSNLKSVKYAIMDGTQSENLSDDDVIAQMSFAEGDWIETINSEGFIELSMSDISPNTKVEVAALATDTNTQTILARNVKTTGNALAQQSDYYGTYTATFNKQLIWDEDADGYLAPSFSDCAAYTRTLVMKPYEVSTEQGTVELVMITGFSEIDPEYPALASVDAAGLLYINDYVTVGEADADGYVPTWLSMGEDLAVYAFGKGYIVAPTEDGYSAIGYTGRNNNGEPVKVASMEIYALSGNNINIYADEIPYVLKAGDFTLVKTEAAPERAAAGFKSFDFSNRKSYVTNVTLQ